jgi:hypothetical protein
MQCPRCGWQNPADISACQRCGLPVTWGDRQAPERSATPTQPGGSGSNPPAPGSGYGPSGGGYGLPTPYGQAPYAPSGQGAGYPAPAPYRIPYAAGAGQQTGYATSPQLAGGWPDQQRREETSGRLVRLLLLAGAVASIGYAVWAFTARRGIFEDFVSNRIVGLDDARASDHADTALIAVAGGLAVIALAWLLLRVLAGRSRGGALTVTTFVIAGLGMICVVAGLVLSGLVGDGNRADEGRQAVTATNVTGSGFVVLAVGLLIGLAAVNSRGWRDRRDPGGPPVVAQGAGPWFAGTSGSADADRT